MSRRSSSKPSDLRRVCLPRDRICSNFSGVQPSRQFFELDRGSKRGLLSHTQRRVSGEPTGLRVKAHAWARLPNGCGFDPCARSAFWLGMQSAQSANALDEAQSGRATSGGSIMDRQTR